MQDSNSNFDDAIDSCLIENDMKVEDYDEYPEPVKEDDFQIPDIENNFEEGEEKLKAVFWSYLYLRICQLLEHLFCDIGFVAYLNIVAV